MRKKIKKILLVDDEHDILTSVKTLLSKEGYEINAVNSGKKALQALKKDKFDIILLDILMPEMSGNEVAEKIRNDPKTKNQKIVFLSVVTLGEQGKIEMKKLRPFDYIQKPIINLKDFKKRIRMAVDAS